MMTVFQQATLKGALTPLHIAAGIWLDEDDHSITLKRTNDDGTVDELAHFGIHAQASRIREEADRWLQQQSRYTE